MQVSSRCRGQSTAGTTGENGISHGIFLHECSSACRGLSLAGPCPTHPALSLAQTGFTTLHQAAINGHRTCIEALIEVGADIQATDQAGATPLQWAALKGWLDCSTLLLDHGAKVDSASVVSMPCVS